jgi:hypothetical protein
MKKENKVETTTIEYDTCSFCDEDLPEAELTNMYEGNPYARGTVRLWCKPCEEGYDPTPQEQWEVTTPSEVYTVVEDEHGRIY